MAYGLSSLFWFALIVAMIPFALWLLRRTPLGGAAAGGPAGLRSVGMLQIGPGQRIVTVEVGSGEERRWLVLGVTAQNISTLHTMAPQADAMPPAPGGPGAAPTFAQLLGRLRTKDRA